MGPSSIPCSGDRRVPGLSNRSPGYHSRAVSKNRSSGGSRHLAKYSETGQSPAVDWLDTVAQVRKNLTTVHRTSDGGLLQAALALRGGNPVVNGGNAKFFAAQNPNVAAAFLARGIAWAGGKEVVVLSPTTEEKSPFVRDTFKRLRAQAVREGWKEVQDHTQFTGSDPEKISKAICVEGCNSPMMVTQPCRSQHSQRASSYQGSET